MANTEAMSEKQEELYNKTNRSRKRIQPILVGELTEAEKKRDREPTQEEEANASERASFHGIAKVVAKACEFASRKFRFENNIDDPSLATYIDPLTRGPDLPRVGKTTGLDLCEMCAEPEDDEADLMQCYTSISGPKFCEKWYHPQCVGMDEAPEGDWLCQGCTNLQLQLLKLKSKVDTAGHTFPVDLKDDDNLSASSEEEEDSEEDDSGSDDDAEYREEEDEGHMDDADFDAIVEHPKPPTKKRKVLYQHNHEQEQEQEQDEDPETKKSRPANSRPTSGVQQMDKKARLGVNALRIPMAKLHRRTIPLTRSDEYDPATMPDAKRKLAPKQAHYPWVVHFAGCLTDQAPNDDAAKEAMYREEPVFQIWVGSEQAKAWAQEYLSSRGDNVQIFVKFDDYYDAFRSDSGKTKKAPQRRKAKKAPAQRRK